MANSGPGRRVQPPDRRKQAGAGPWCAPPCGRNDQRRPRPHRGAVCLEDDGGGRLAGPLDLLVALQVLVVVVDVHALASLSLDLRDDERHQGRGVENDDDDDVEQLVDLTVAERLLEDDVDERAVDHDDVAGRDRQYMSHVAVKVLALRSCTGRIK